ncbi:phosphatidyl inositol kinase, partial [Mortierella claussenii]
MPTGNGGYLPLGHDDPDEQVHPHYHQQRQQEEEPEDEHHNSSSHEESDSPNTRRRSSGGGGQSTLNQPSHLHQQQQVPSLTRSASQTKDTQQSAATSSSAVATISGVAGETTAPAARPPPHAIASAPAAPQTASPSSTSNLPSFQFPRFGTKHKSLLGVSSSFSHDGSNLSNNANNAGFNSPYARLVGGSPQKVGGRESARAATASDLANIRPKQHPHTTHSGPRGIEKSQKREILREIRPDPHNLPEELLREQARSGATVDAIASGVLLQPQQVDGVVVTMDESLLTTGAVTHSTPNSPGSNTAGERRTLLGSGDGLGLGIGLGGKANASPHSRWGGTRPGRRQRRVPSSGLGRENDHRIIQSSVFSPVLVSVGDGQPVKPAPALTPDHAEPVTSERFVAIVDSVKDAIHSGIQPLRIAQGSSGSYFCRNIDGKIVGVFKPKNEEPYGQLNPKWAKWIHRNLFPCCFGRSCLIPNLGYISEAATSLVDRRLKLNIVPSTEVVWLSSPAFHYDYLDRRTAKLNKGAKPLPDKVGSFQLFLNGFKDANLFMRDHPWPAETASVPPPSLSGSGDAHRKGKRPTTESVHDGHHSQHHQIDMDSASLHGSIAGSAYGGLAASVSHGSDRPGFHWTPALQQQFREQFEKMIILDYLIRNTDRGLDNWMIRYCEREGISIVAGPQTIGNQKGNLQPSSSQQAAEATRRNSRVGDLLGLNSDRSGSLQSSSSSLRDAGISRGGRNGMLATPPGTPPRSNLSRAPSGMESVQAEDTQETGQSTVNGRSGAPETRISNGNANATHSSATDWLGTMESYYGTTHVHVAAIDNGLAFPFKHPDSWRSYPYGWLFLPRPLISQSFTKATRDHFLPLLSSPIWWRETIADLRRLFSIDSDFDQGMFDKQMAVMKGQGWNIVETLKNLEHGPMDLCRRVALVVWDEEVTLQAGATASMLAQFQQQQQQQSALSRNGFGAEGGEYITYGQSYTNAQPKAMIMDPTGNNYSQYGSIMSARDRLSNARTLSASSTAVDESTPFMTASHDRSLYGSLKKGPLPHLVINMDGKGDQHDGHLQSSVHGSYRQVVSDGEYDLDDGDEDDDDDDDDDEDAFSFDENYDDFEDGELVGTSNCHTHGASQTQLTPVVRDGMISIDMTLANQEEVHAPARSHRRRQSEGGISRTRRSRHHSISGVSHVGEGSTSMWVPSSNSNAAGARRNHRRSRTEQGASTIRFDSSVAVSSNRARGDNSLSGSRDGGLDTVRSSLLLLSASSKAAGNDKAPFDSTEDSASKDQEVERGREFFARGNGVISPLSSLSKSHGERRSAFDAGERERLSERPKWADRLRRGLSFDGHLLAVGGIGGAARSERKLRKQRQRERELREQRVVLIERIEPVTKNLPYFKW